MIKEKDYFILEILERVTVATNKQLMILAGYRDPSVIRKRLNKLKEMGVIKASWLGEHLAYTLTQRGLLELEKTRHEYEIRNIKSEHEELVTAAACWLYIKSGLSIKDMLFDRDLNSLQEFKGTGHKPDIVFPAHRCLEVELNAKSTAGNQIKNGLEDNIRDNISNYSRQFWIVPDRKPGIKNRIKSIAEKNGEAEHIYVISLEKMLEDIDAFEIKQNVPRTEITKKPATPKAKKMEVMFDD